MAQNGQVQGRPNNQQPRQSQGPADATALLRNLLDQQKNDILDAVSSFVNTKFDTFQTKIDETQQKITDAVEENLSSLDSYKFKKKHFERKIKFNKSIRTKTFQALSAVSSGKIDKARQLLSSGISELDHQQKLLKLADKSDYGWLVLNEYVDKELASDEEDDKRIRKAEKSAASKVEKLKKGFRFRHKSPNPYVYNRGPATQIPDVRSRPVFSNSNSYFPNHPNLCRPQRYGTFSPSDICWRCGKAGHWAKFCVSAPPQSATIANLP